MIIIVHQLIFTTFHILHGHHPNYQLNYQQNSHKPSKNLSEYQIGAFSQTIMNKRTRNVKFFKNFFLLTQWRTYTAKIPPCSVKALDTEQELRSRAM